MGIGALLIGVGVGVVITVGMDVGVGVGVTTAVGVLTALKIKEIKNPMIIKKIITAMMIRIITIICLLTAYLNLAKSR